jgi:hypothetical protein
MTIRFDVPTNFSANLASYETVTQWFSLVESLENYELNFRETRFFGAELTAILGALEDSISGKFESTFSLIDMQTPVRTILQKNDFLTHLGHAKQHDTYHTTVPYNVYQPNEEKRFDLYIQQSLLSKFPSLSSLQESIPRKDIRRSLLEVFTNAALHGACKRIFTCGQHYPKNSELGFCIVDCGQTIQDNVQRHLGCSLSPVEAIEWAMQPGHTTKQSTTGGLGLANLRQFLQHTGGKLHIVSGSGCCIIQPDGTQQLSSLSHAFPGTIVNIIFSCKPIQDALRYSTRNFTSF